MYDVIIVGGGIAGLTASIYCARYKLKTLVISRGTGGIILDAYIVENYPGFIKISGKDLMKKIEDQAKGLGIEIREGNILSVERAKDGFIVKTKNNQYESKTLIISTGTERRKLNVPGEERFLKRGVHYCATCDAPWYKDKVVALVGGGNSACRAAEILSEYAKKIHMIFVEDLKEMLAEPCLSDKVKGNRRIELYPNSSVSEIKGKEKVESVVVMGKEVKVDGVFVEIGYVPDTGLFNNLKIKTDKKGFIDVDKEQKTSTAGVFAAGDITNACNFKQLITASAQGAVAANSAYRHLKEKFNN